MYRTMLKGKLHQAKVTDANLNYVGSITIDSDLIKAADMLPYEKVSIVNNNNGARWETYIISGEPGSGEVCLNGAAARLVQPGDIVIIMSFVEIKNTEMANYSPQIVILDGEKNKIIKTINNELELD